MEITDRQNLILEKVIREYIGSAEPVSSGLLEKKYDFNLSPAMIRIEMERLTDAGYLFQPFVSSGRVPTDKGYRFFVNRLLAEKKEPDTKKESFKRAKAELGGEKGDLWAFSQRLTKFLSEESSSMALLSLIGQELFFKDGWEEVIREPEFAFHQAMIGFGDFIRELEENMADLETTKEVRVYIGKELPFPEGKDFSLIITELSLPQRKKAKISLIGPKRMAYEKNIELVGCLSELLSGS